ncbi:prestin isoform X1 [Parasteatoda tepidariorum]|uniref:prestin isoform X1 n=1 Tax=Parasteatoda tepidariorum TaxID=114398 RepID=UPI001C71AE15|nr:solute carrier family 26 member 6 isoform X1 [Parasteatoda tepidariorum]XP_015927774.2 solute carrier family 26 member 6 isoform X1 [Parasteatoda tepidariorum]XP_015927775.2 solute carrier family 26 member 6 isoform X1 [Parasteatoda tepidariorum]
MSWTNTWLPLVRKLGRRLTGDEVAESEKIRILPATASKKNTNSANHQQETDDISCSAQSSTSSFANESSSSKKRKQVNQTDDEYYKKDSSFYNMGFTLSPSDLERSWKQTRSSISGGSASESSLRRTKSECKISINREPIDNTYIEKQCGPKPSDTATKKAKKYFSSHCNCSMACIVSFFTSLFPILSWLPKYRREYFISDIIAGFTISILHIPQGMAYGVLASVKAQNGLYVSFFPVLIYCLLGTSRHISIGTFAVISLMLSNAVFSAGAVSHKSLVNETLQNGSTTNVVPDHITSIEVVTTIALSVGLLQIGMGVFRLGSLSVVLSDQLVSGFSTGAACHVATSQMKDLFGITVNRYSGALQLIYSLRDVLQNVMHTNIATLITSAIAIFTLAFFKEQIDGRLKGRLRMPIPIDLIVVVVATTISYGVDLHHKYGVSIIKDIPTGLPAPNPPRMDLFFPLLVHSISVAIVIFAISLSMAKLLSKKHKYTIRPNQELIALGSANVFASFFSCYPCSASLSRSLVQERAGGKTQVAGIVSCCILLIVLLALAPMFYSLPKSILSCIILVALKPMFLQVKDFWSAWKISKLDALIWLVTCLATVFINVTYGLLVGVLFSLLSVIARTVIPSRTFLGRVPDSDIYLDLKRYDAAREIKGIKIFHFESALYFINRELFKSYLNKHIPLKDESSENALSAKNSGEKVHRIIIDCSTFSFIDLAGLDTLLEIMKEYQEAGISVYLAACSMAMLDVMAKAKFFEKTPLHPSVFPTIHDAVEFQYFSHVSGNS